MCQAYRKSIISELLHTPTIEIEWSKAGSKIIKNLEKNLKTFFNTEEELIKATGAKVGDYQKIGVVTPAGEKGLQQINPLTDISKERALLRGELDPKTGDYIWAEKANQALKKPPRDELVDQFQSGIGVKPGETKKQFIKRLSEDKVLVDRRCSF